jgi:parallel beta-helix repeat protein
LEKGYKRLGCFNDEDALAMEVKRGSLIIAFLVLASAFYTTLTTVPLNVKAATLFVGGSGPGNFTTIQGALDASFPGDFVFVYDGTYEENILISKPLSLIGENKDTTIVDGRGRREAVNISASNVNITGLTITNGGSGMTPGIEIFSVGRANVSGNAIIDSGYGALLYESDWNVFTDNVFSNDRDGARLVRSRFNLFSRSDFHGNRDAMDLFNATDNVITHNNMSFNSEHSVMMMGSDRNVITDNVFYDDRFSIWMVYSHDNILVNNIFSLSLNALTLDVSHSNLISNNEMTYHSSSAMNMQYGKYNIITDNTISWNNREGIVLEDSDHNMVGGNTVLSNNNHGIRIWYCHNNSIVGNTISSNRLEGISSYQSIFDVILNNTVSSSDWSDGIEISQSNRYLVDNNIVSSNNEHGIKVWSSHNNTLMNNQMTNDGIFILGDALEHWNTHTIDTSNTVGGKPVRYLKNTTGGSVLPDAGQVIIANCTDTLVENQDVSNGSVGIEMGFSSRITVSNNIASDNVWGIFSYHSDNGTLTMNVAEWSYFGLYLADYNNDTVASQNDFFNGFTGIGVVGDNRNVTIANNLVSRNTRGMYLRDMNYGRLLENIVSLNADEGISMVHSDNNTLVGNIFSKNGLNGLHMWGADDCHIYHNNFLDNSYQAFDSPGGSQWDDGYPSGGNYWSNYTGADIFSGPNQDLPGSDGIGDTPFVIDADSIDRYPLMASLPGVNNPPIASFTISPISGNVTVTFTVNASSSSDLEDSTEALEVRWDWEDDGSWDTVWSTLKEAQHQYSVPGNYTVRLEIRDTIGLKNQTTNDVIVSNLAPACNISDPTPDAIVSGILTIKGEAHDSDGSVEFVEIRINNGNWTQVTGRTAWTFDWDTTTVPDGQHAIHVRSFDGMDYSAEVSVIVMIDNLDPRDSGQDWLWTAAAATIIVVVAVLLALLILRRKNREPEEQDSPEKPVEEDSET